MSNSTKINQDLQAEIDRKRAEFLAGGGQITQVARGVCSEKPFKGIDKYLKKCRCGCQGDWTAHSMRAAESGRPNNIIVK